MKLTLKVIVCGLYISLGVTAGQASAPVIHGVVVEGKTAFVSIRDRDGDSGPAWVEVGKRWDSYTILEVSRTAESVRLLSHDGTMIEVPVTKGPNNGSLPAGAGLLVPLDKLDWKWIKSDANPMRKQPTPLPVEVALAWKDLSERAQYAWISYYRAHGFALSFHSDPEGLRVSLRVIRQPGVPRDTTNKVPVNTLPQTN